MSCSFYVGAERLTCAKAVPYLLALSNGFSINPFIIGAYSSSNPSSSWSVKRRASTYTKLEAGQGWVEVEVRTLLLAENRTSRDPLRFPTPTASVPIN